MSRFSKFQAVVVVNLTILLVPSLLHSQQLKSSGGGLKGVREFFNTATGNTFTFIPPGGVTHVMVTMWGGGGSGGTFGGGGGGAYTNTVVSVSAGVAYTVTVGIGGNALANADGDGNSGTASQFALGTTILTFAGGGQGGPGSSSSALTGSGGQADSSAQISHTGFQGTAGSFGFGGKAYAFNLSPAPNQSGIDCDQCSWGDGSDPGSIGLTKQGNDGYVLLTF